MKRILSIFLSAALLALALAGCGGGAQKEKDKVRLCEVTHSVFYAPQYAAIHLGFFEEEGIEVELSNGGGADKVMAAVLSDGGLYLRLQRGQGGLHPGLRPAHPAGRLLPYGQGAGPGFLLGEAAGQADPLRPQGGRPLHGPGIRHPPKRHGPGKGPGDGRFGAVFPHDRGLYRGQRGLSHLL